MRGFGFLSKAGPLLVRYKLFLKGPGNFFSFMSGMASVITTQLCIVAESSYRQYVSK